MIILFIFFWPIIFYFVYQMIRNNAIFNIRSKWIDTNDARWDKYTYNYMVDPAKHNWYGFKFPRNSHFKS